jgi:hypothetical protein
MELCRTRRGSRILAALQALRRRGNFDVFRSHKQQGTVRWNTAD